MISNNNRKCCRSGYFVGILTYINHRLIHIFCDIEAGGIIRVLRLNLRYGYAVICCRADAVIAGHIHAVLKGRTGRCVKYLHIKGDYYAFACSQITHQHGQRRLLVAIRQNSRIDDKFALHTLVYRHIKGVHHLRIRCDCVRRERQRA